MQMLTKEGAEQMHLSFRVALRAYLDERTRRDSNLTRIKLAA